jgi:hypothetical protein
MKKKVLEKRIRRSVAAVMLGLSPASLRRYELRGILQGFKLNSRITLYKEVDVLRLANGELETSSPEAVSNIPPGPRTRTGNFAPHNFTRAKSAQA